MEVLMAGDYEQGIEEAIAVVNERIELVRKHREAANTLSNRRAYKYCLGQLIHVREQLEDLVQA